jgi:hypothetical protein
MHLIRSASDALRESDVSAASDPARSEAASKTPSCSPPSSGVTTRPARSGNPFASLTQEKTVEAKVSAEVLNLCAFGGATTVYRVPNELLKMARRRKAASETPGGPRVRGPVPAPSLAAAMGKRFQALQIPAWIDSTSTWPPPLNRSLAAVTLVALICAIYRLMMG